MNQQRLLFEFSPLFILLCAGVALAYAWVLYSSKQGWSIMVNRMLFAFRVILVFFICLLLVGPILKLTQNTIEKPELVFLIDNSVSVKEGTDSVQREKIKSDLTTLAGKLNGYEVSQRDLSGAEALTGKFDQSSSDLAGAMRNAAGQYEGKNLAGVVLVSDGIYNSGASPLYAPLHLPVFTVGVGDTAQRMDLALKNVAFNKIAYQGNKFPLRAEVIIDGFANQNINATVSRGGVVLGRQMKNSGAKNLLDFDFELDAKEKGLQRVDVFIEPANGEKNIKNNRATAFIEVVEGKKKILVIAPAPHPDIKALRAVVEKNSNYEFILHIPGVQEADPSMLVPGKTDLIIFHQIMDVGGKTPGLYTRLAVGPTSLLLIAGTSSNLRAFAGAQLPISFERAGQWDEATPIINPAFRDFQFAENVNLAFSKYPPVAVPFGKFTSPSDASVLLHQRIGSVETDRPMLMTMERDGRKTGILVGEGIWRWRLNEYSETEKTEAFDEVFGKLIQYLSTQDDKRKFRVFPTQHEFTDAEAVVFESQVYNDLFQQVYGNTIAIDLTNEQGKVVHYNYVTSAGGTRYRIGGLKEGVYKFTGSTVRNGKHEEMRGEFLVRAQNVESQNLTADFGLLRKLASTTGGTFHPAGSIATLENDIKKMDAKARIHSEESYNPLINLKWVFFALLLLVTAEWALRKYLGGY